jgi:hypothetical protein
MTSPVSQFNESVYLAFYHDLDAVIPSQYPTGINHFQAVGRFSGPNKKEGFFTGDSGNNIITGFGDDMDIYGVALTATFTPGSGASGPAIFTPGSFGVGERDTLVGRNSLFYEDGFFLSVPNGSYSRTGASTGMTFGTSSRLYVGEGSQDFARVVNFNPEYDYVSLAGAPKDYVYKYQTDNKAPGGYSLKIYTKAEHDLVGVVEGINDVQPRNFLADNSFRLSGRVPARGFNDAVYDELNGTSGGLNDYATGGQSSGKIGVFSGAPNGSPTTNSSSPVNGNDTLIAYGAGNRTIISGVGLSIDSSGKIVAESGLGATTTDVLVGGENTKDDFWLGIGDDLIMGTGSGAQSFYVGSGSATIQNYQKRDRVVLAGVVADYTFTSNGGNVEISKGGDLIGTVEGVSGLRSTSILENGTFSAKFFVENGTFSA